MRLYCSLLAALVLSLPLTARDAAAPSAHKHTPAANETAALCNNLIEEARRIESILRGVTDKASADDAAKKLAQCSIKMQAFLSELEKMPFDAETTLIITTQMTALTHITQRYMERVNELQQSGAYESTLLAEQLNKLLADEEYSNADEGEPLAPIYSEMERLLGDALYMLRKAQDTASAKDAASALRDILAQQTELHKEVTQTADSASVDYTTHGSISYLVEELDKEFTRLKEADFYGDPDLASLLQRYIKSFKQ